eukprot:6483343-Amphidinium_carterae.1
MCRKGDREIPGQPSLRSHKDLHAPLFHDEAWLLEVTSGKVAKGDTLGSNEVQTLDEDGETVSLTSDCLQLRRR